jgi:hypothetical protein
VTDSGSPTPRQARHPRTQLDQITVRFTRLAACWPQYGDELFAVDVLYGLALAHSIDDAYPSRAPWPMHTVAMYTMMAGYSAVMSHTRLA